MPPVKDVFEHLRVTTLDVTQPLFELLRVRGEMIKAAKEFIDKQPDNQAKTDILITFEKFAEYDLALVDVINGSVDKLPRRLT